MPCMIPSLYRLFAAALILILPFSVQSAAEENYRSLHEKLGRTASVSVQNAPTGFRTQLLLRNAGNDVLRFADTNTPFLDADIWVFFLESEAKADQLPSLAFKLFRSLQHREEGAVAHCAQFSLTTGEEKTACFHFLDKYDASDTPHSIACKAAISIHGEVSGIWTSEERRQMTAECIRGS